MKRAVISSAMALSLAACSPSGDETTIENRLEYANQIKAEYIEKLGCFAVDVAFSVENQPVAVPEDAPSPAAITYGEGDVRLIENYALESTDSMFYSAVAHEMTHACAGPETRTNNPYRLKTGELLVGVIGLSPILNLDGQEGIFTIIEEGVAEYLAVSQMDADLMSSHPAYRRLGELTKDLVEETDVSDEKLADFVQQSNFIGFIATLNGITRAEVESPHIDAVMTRYQEAYFSNSDF